MDEDELGIPSVVSDAAGEELVIIVRERALIREDDT